MPTCIVHIRGGVYAFGKLLHIGSVAVRELFQEWLEALVVDLRDLFGEILVLAELADPADADSRTSASRGGGDTAVIVAVYRET